MPSAEVIQHKAIISVQCAASRSDQSSSIRVNLPSAAPHAVSQTRLWLMQSATQFFITRNSAAVATHPTKAPPIPHMVAVQLK